MLSIDSPPRRGRPRDPRVDDAVRVATMDLLVDGGYPAVTIEGVARRAGVGPASVYRRWPSKAHLVHEVVFPDEQRLAVDPDAALPEVLAALARGVLESFSRPEARAALPGLMAEFDRDPELRRRLQARFEPEVHRALGQALAEAGASTAADLLLDAVLGTVLAAVVVSERIPGARFADDLVDLLMRGVR